MDDIEKFKKYENNLGFRHYRYLIEKQIYKNITNMEITLIFILLINLIQMILMLLLLGK